VAAEGEGAMRKGQHQRSWAPGSRGGYVSPLKRSQVIEDIQVLRNVAADESKLGFVREGAERTAKLLEAMLEKGEVRS
jgi:hypothetical protein